jgi:TPR repeat protein
MPAVFTEKSTFRFKENTHIMAIARTCLLPLLLLAAATSTAADRPAPATAPAGADAAQNPPLDKDFVCVDGYESLLPGDYYACRARYHFARQHYGQAAEMLKEAAYWANKDAQYTLGLMYFNGDTPKIAQNRPLGIAWLALAAERKNPDYVQTYAAARLRATPAETQQASVLWQALREKYGDKVAGLRAKRRFDRNIKDMEESANEGGIAYLSGFGPFPQSANVIVGQLHKDADQLFAGMDGVVTIGAPAQTAPAPASSTASPGNGH